VRICQNQHKVRNALGEEKKKNEKRKKKKKKKKKKIKKKKKKKKETAPPPFEVSRDPSPYHTSKQQNK
jgi:hypothetical protein